jgi:hypothetical protein
MQSNHRLETCKMSWLAALRYNVGYLSNSLILHPDCSFDWNVRELNPPNNQKGSRMRAYMERLRLNRALLRRIADDVGKEIEGWPYKTLSRPSEEISFKRVIEGIEVVFSIEAYDRNQAGDIRVCADVDSNIPSFWLALPSYIFWKRTDESVYYT